MQKSFSWLVVFIFITAFVEGGAVMSIELLGAKLIAPFYGTSLYVWSATLAITLSGLGMGYFLGAFISEKKKSLDVPYFFLLGAALLVGMMNHISFWIMTATIEMEIRTGTVISLLVFLFPPLVLLGSTSPLLIGHLSRINAKTGKNAGLVYAISTFGGIVCTFIVGFYFIVNFGIKITTFYTATLLFVVPLVYFVFFRRKWAVAGVLIVFLLLSAYLNRDYLERNYTIETEDFRVLYKSDGILGSVAVVDMLPNKRMLMINNTGQTLYDIPTKKAIWEYVHRIATYASTKSIGSEVLVCGLGGGVLVNELLELGFNVDACDFDARLERVAKDYFYLSNEAKVYIDDARHFIKTSEKHYDIVVLDLSFGENVPSNIYTKECFEEIKSKLKDDAYVFVHYINDLNRENGIAAKSLAKTIESAGFNVDFLNTKHRTPNSNEVMYFASVKKINLQELEYDRSPRFSDSVFHVPKFENVYLSVNYSDGIILTDDKPIMDILHRRAALKLREAEEKITREMFEERSIMF